jgi:hypothetical protein
VKEHPTSRVADDADDDGPITGRRLVDRLRRHWREAYGHDRFPSVDSIDPWMIGDDWKDCFMVEIRSPLQSSEIIAIGEHLCPRPYWQLERPAVRDVPDGSLLNVIVSRLAYVLSRRDCLFGEGEIEELDHTILYRCVLLPLSADGVHIDLVLGAINCKFAPKTG